jgi:hypothetical protein
MRHLVPPAEGLGRLSAPLCGAAAPPQDHSAASGFAPNPWPASRAPGSARQPQRPCFYPAWSELVSAICLAVTLTSGCHFFGGVRLNEVATASGKPSNVATLVSVTQKGEPVTDLGVAAFKLTENGQPLDAESVSLRLLDPAAVTAFHTVLLVDLGHGTAAERRRQLSRGAATFVRRMRQKQAVTVLGFDGSPRTRLVGEFSVESSGTGPEQLDNLMQMTPADPSRDLNGAVLAGLDLLDGRLERSNRPIHMGTLVVFSRGPDVAGRVSDADLDQRLHHAEHQLIYVTVAGDPSDKRTTALSSLGKIEAQAADTLPIALEDAAALASRLSSKYYLLSYCSPARAGERALRVEVLVNDADGHSETDAFETRFDSTGFSPSCNSNTPPRFSLSQRTTGERTPGAGSANSAAKAPVNTTSSGGSPTTGTPESAPVLDMPAKPESDIEVPPPKKRGYAP